MIKLEKFEKEIIREISTLSGYTELVVREVLEFTFLRQVEFLLSNEPVHIPFIGSMDVDYKGDEFEQGNRVAVMDCTLSPSDLFTRVVGDVADGESDIIKDILSKKVENELQTILSK